LKITPYYASLLDPDDPLQPIRRSVVPVKDEYNYSPFEADDPLGEEHHRPVRAIVHRYPDRVLFLVSNSDPMVLALTLHKGMTKRVIRDLKIATPDFCVIEDETQLKKVDFNWLK
jgi:hypothetical protein